jgi:hypothetical protein
VDETRPRGQSRAFLFLAALRHPAARSGVPGREGHAGYEWRALARDLWQARSWRARLLYIFIFGQSGWRPGGKGLTTGDLRRAAALAVAVE